MKGNNVNDNGLAIDLMCYECMFCIVLTCRVQGLCDSRVCDASMTQYIAWRRALLPKTDTMTRTNKLDSSKVCFDRVYRPRMLRGMDVFHPMLQWYPRLWEGIAETRPSSCCDDDGRIPARRGQVHCLADAIALRFLCGQVGEADIHFYTSRGRIWRVRTQVRVGGCISSTVLGQGDLRHQD